MTAIRFDIIGFDLDGTLLDTHRDLGAAVNHALVLGGRKPVEVEDIEALIGGGAKIMLKRALEEQGGISDEDFRPLYKALLSYYAEHNAVHTRPYAGAEAVLRDLADRGIAMAVVTNKFESFAQDILTKLGLAGHFAAIIGGDTMGKGRAKPEPDPIYEAIARCGGGSFAFFGDSSYDVAAARAAKVPVVVAGYGYCDQPPHELGGDAVVHGFDQLIGVLESL